MCTRHPMDRHPTSQAAHATTPTPPCHTPTPHPHATSPRHTPTPTLTPTPHAPHAPHAGKLAALQGLGPVFLMAATLRPETMYGQTNAWVLPEGQYGAYRGVGGEIYVLTERSALNLSFLVGRRAGWVGWVGEAFLPFLSL